MTVTRSNPAPQRTFTIIELDDYGAPYGDAVVHTETIDDTDPGYRTLACVFKLPGTDEYYRFYYRQYKTGRGPLDRGWDDGYSEGVVPCTRVTHTLTLTPQWVGINRAVDAQLTWTGGTPLRANDGLLLPLAHEGTPICKLLIPDEDVSTLVRTLGGTPSSVPTGLVGVTVAAKELDVTATALSKMRQRAQVPAQLIDGTWMYNVQAARAAIEAHRAEREAARAARAGQQLALDE